jgi:hypothetical protein
MRLVDILRWRSRSTATSTKSDQYQEEDGMQGHQLLVHASRRPSAV